MIHFGQWSKVLWNILPLCHKHPSTSEVHLLLLTDKCAHPHHGLTLKAMSLVRDLANTFTDIIVRPEWGNYKVWPRKKIGSMIGESSSEGEKTICSNLKNIHSHQSSNIEWKYQYCDFNMQRPMIERVTCCLSAIYTFSKMGLDIYI